jgi:two-component system phosphate regulon response regulator PhoB
MSSDRVQATFACGNCEASVVTESSAEALKRPLILVVDDEADIVDTLTYNLQQEGFRTRSARTGAEALKGSRERPLPDLVLLDLMLPDISGTEVCRELRLDDALRRVPVIMLTAKDAEIDRVVGFEVGADDYVTKPFSVRELLLRVRAVLRRAKDAPPVSTAKKIEFGRLKVDPDAHQVWVDGLEIVLTALEFRLLSTLLERRGRVQTRTTLLEDVWGIHADITTRTVDTHVKRLREKLGPAGEYVETIRGVGYRLRAQPPE